MTTPYLSNLLLYAGMTKEQLVEYVRNKSVKEELENINEILESWQDASNFLHKLETDESGIADNNNTFDFSSDLIEQIKQNPLIRTTHSKYHREFKLVEIDNLITIQQKIFLDYVDELAKIIPEKPSEDQIVKICLAPKQLTAPPEPLRIDETTFSFKSPSSNFRFLGGYLKQQITPDDIHLTDIHGFPTHVLTLFVGYPQALVKVSSVNGRLILRNGFHRAYLLRKKGIKKIPALVSIIENPEQDFPNKLHQQTKDYLLKHPRPVLMKDFFNDKLIRVFKRKKTISELKIKWETEESKIDF